MERGNPVGPGGAGGAGTGRATGHGEQVYGGEREGPGYIYALGEIALHLPSPGIRREFTRVAEAQLGTRTLDMPTLHALLSRRENRYLARLGCWVLAREGTPVYLLRPRDPAEIDLLIEYLQAEPETDNFVLVVGVEGELDPDDVCGALEVPLVYFDQIESVIRAELLEAVRARLSLLGDIGARYLVEVRGALRRILQLAGAGGSLAEYRALSYLAVRHPEIYLRVTSSYVRGYELTDVQPRATVLASGRTVVDVIFIFTNPDTGDTQQYFAQVDVTEEYPFLTKSLAPYPPASEPPPGPA